MDRIIWIFVTLPASACPPPARNASQREAGGSQAAQARRAGMKLTESNQPTAEERGARRVHQEKGWRCGGRCYLTALLPS